MDVIDRLFGPIRRPIVHQLEMDLAIIMHQLERIVGPKDSIIRCAYQCYEAGFARDSILFPYYFHY